MEWRIPGRRVPSSVPLIVARAARCGGWCPWAEETDRGPPQAPTRGPHKNQRGPGGRNRPGPRKAHRREGRESFRSALIWTCYVNYQLVLDLVVSCTFREDAPPNPGELHRSVNVAELTSVVHRDLRLTTLVFAGPAGAVATRRPYASGEALSLECVSHSLASSQPALLSTLIAAKLFPSAGDSHTLFTFGDAPAWSLRYTELVGVLVRCW